MPSSYASFLAGVMKIKELACSNKLLRRKPLASIMISTYDEKNVVDRYLRPVPITITCEVMVVDNSTDETADILRHWPSTRGSRSSTGSARRVGKGGACLKGHIAMRNG